MALAALILTIVFAILTVGVRAAIQARRTGTTGIHRFDREPGSPEGRASSVLALSFVLLGLGPLLGVVGLLDPVAVLDSPTLRAVGVVLACAGVLLVFAAQLAMGDSWRVGVEEEDRTELVTGGIFAIVRNPIYTVTFLAVAGLALMVPNPVELLGFVVIVVAYELLVRWVEEPFLIQIHGDTYRGYAARVGRFVPGLGLIRP
jgi:protein-S-isoprenylcysteine O-methyltransferase Ste14